MNYKNYHKNPRSITEDQKDNLAQWINELGDISGIVYDINTQEIPCGNQRSGVINLDECNIEIVKTFDPPNEQGTIQEGYVVNSSGARLNYRSVDWTPEQCEKANIIANKAGGTWNWDILETQFQKDDLIEWGFDESEFGIGVEETEVTTGDDDVPEVQEQSETVKGDLWELGNHRLLCGDSTLIDDVEKLMGGEKADITFTSPPYNVGKTPNGNKQKYLNSSDNKDTKDFVALLNDFTTNSLLFTDYVFSNIQSLAGNKVAIIEHMYHMREKFSDTIIWDKKTAEPAMARRVLNSRFEYIHIFSNEAKRTVGKRDFRGTIENIFELNSRKGKDYAKIHKATFPVELPLHFIKNFTESSCLDPFCGTGTTLIACEKTKRVCYGIELDPCYCDVVVKRYIKFCTANDIKLDIKLNGEKYSGLLIKNDT